MKIKLAECIVGVVAAAAVLAGCQPGPEPIPVDTNRAYIDAQSAIRQAAESESPQTRIYAIKSLADTLGDQAGGVYVQALGDPDPGVAFAAAIAIGDIRYAPAKDKLLKIAEAQGPDKRLLVGAIYALHQIGHTQYTSWLGRLLMHNEPEVRGLAAMVMGKMGNTSAIQPLKYRLVYEGEARSTQSIQVVLRVKLEIVKALARLGDPASLQRLQAYARQPYSDMQVVAAESMVELNAPNTVDTLGALVDDEQHPRVRAKAMGGLERLGYHKDAYFNYLYEAARRPEQVLAEAYGDSQEITEDDAVWLQQIAAESLGWTGRKEAVGLLHRLLQSSSGLVRTAAAMSLLRLIQEPTGLVGPEDTQDGPPADTLEEPTSKPAEVDPMSPLPRLKTSGYKD